RTTETLSIEVEILRADAEQARRALEVSELDRRVEFAQLNEKALHSQNHERAEGELRSECERLQAEVESLRQVQQSVDLKQRPDDAERLNRVLADVLEGIGIKYQTVLPRTVPTD